MNDQRFPIRERIQLALLGFGGLTFAFYALLIFNDLVTARDNFLLSSFEVHLIFGLFGAPILVWHIFDLIDPQFRRPSILRRLVSYPAILSFAIIALALLIAMNLGVGSYNSCDELDGAYFHSCNVGTSLWILIPFAAACGLAWLLAIIKALTAAWYSITS